MYNNVYICLPLFTPESLPVTHAYSCLPTCTLVYLRLLLFIYDYLCSLLFTLVYLCLPLFTRACLPFVTLDYSCLTMFTLPFTYAYPLYTFLYVCYSCLPKFTGVHLC